MSDTTDTTSDVSQVADDASTGRRRRSSGSGLSAKLLPELQAMAAGLGITGTGRMRKGELIAAITAAQSGGSPRARAAAAPTREEVRAEVREPAEESEAGSRTSRRATRSAGPPKHEEAVVQAPVPAPAQEEDHAEPGRRDRGDRRERNNRDRGERGERGDREQRGDRVDREQRGDRVDRGDRGDRGDREQRGDRGDRDRDRFDGDGDEDGDSRRSRRSRFRDRRRGRDRGTAGEGSEPQVTEDDVLVPVAGIVDVLENYAFVRTTGYLSGPNDVYVSMSQIKKYGLRRGDAITGAVRATREGEQRRDKYNPLVRLDTINGMDPDEARKRPEFYKLTPLYPQERLRLETEPHILTTRVIDLVMPIGKGQRALIVSPPKAGKTMIQQAIANAITRNNPECHLMVVLVDERPEEVTDMQRSVKGEVIASTFDRPPQDHTTVAELAI